MDERVEITDRGSAGNWLASQTFEKQVEVAARSACRILPVLGAFPHANESSVSLPLLRSLLISSCAGVSKVDSLRLFSKVAVSAHAVVLKLGRVSRSGHSEDFGIVRSSIRAAIGCLSVGTSSYTSISDAALAVDATARGCEPHGTALKGGSRAAYLAASSDTQTLTGEEPLWPGGSLIENLATGWASLRSQWDADDADWSFWIEWYEGILNGTPLDWELTQRIALEITDAEWDAGQAVVARRIKEIQTQFLSDRIPLAEELSNDPVTGLFQIQPIEVQNPPLMAALLSRVQDALDDAVQGNNGLNANSREVRVLNRTVSQYANNPQRIEMDFTSIAIGLRRQLHETHDLPQSEDNHALLEAVEEGVRGIRANHPDVTANRTQLAQQHMREMSEADRHLLEEAQPFLAAISQGTLHDDFATDIPQLINDALLPLPNGAPPLPGMDESARIFGRVSRISLLYKELTAKGAKVLDSNTIKTVRLVGVLGGVSRVLWALVQLGLRLFSVL